jgi:hypothetical protein
LPKALASVMPLISGRHFGGGPKQRLTTLSAFQGHKLDICQLPESLAEQTHCSFK